MSKHVLFHLLIVSLIKVGMIRISDPHITTTGIPYSLLSSALGLGPPKFATWRPVYSNAALPACALP